MTVVLCKRTAVACIVSMLIMLRAVPLAAQQNNTYSLQALTDSLQHYMPVLLQKKALVNSAKAGVTDAKHSFLPKVMVTEELSLSSSNSLPGAYLPMGVVPSVSGSIRSANNLEAATGNIASLYGEYDLVNFGLRKAKINQAEAYVDVEQSDYERELYLLKMRLAQLYFAVLRNRLQLGVEAQNIQRYESLYEVISALTGSGIRAGVDSSLARAELAKSRISYNQRAGSVKQLLNELSYLTGIPAADINVDTSANRYSASASPVFSMGTLNHPLLQYFSSQKNLYLSNEVLIKKTYLPKISLAAGGWGRGSSIRYTDEYASLGNGLGYQRFNYAAGIAFTYDLFNGTHKRDKLLQSRYQSEAAGHALEQQQLWLKNSISQAEESISIAEKNLRELPYQLQAASDAYEQKLAQYKAGMINLVDMTNAAFVLYSAQNSFIETMNDWYLANLDKAAAAGSIDAFIQQLKR